MNDGQDADAFAGWLRLREPADAAARAADLLEPVRRRLAGTRPVVVHDLGAGTGSMGRWLAPRLPGPQHWILYDRDPGLLARARSAMVDTAADGAPVTVQTRQADLTRLTAADLADASLVTASALLDMLTADELGRIVAACAGRAALLTLSVVGRVELTPADPLDAEVAAAFDDHQRRTVDGRTLLGPDAVDACVAAFARHGVGVDVRPSPWRLGPDRADLAAAWFTGWLGAAREQRPELTGPTTAYARRRLADAAAGRLDVLVDHRDLLVGCR
ncbi:class I SAM-dependent methyltransferase [Micromonospora sp. NBC_01655]|uniref:class I SAM-dependent methyltransferase n=1 Tax=Micromonospora sp. NBC_01655 TaxID=2975983 RepID=UPI0022507E18|nr:class I SAM-dependent methyltransferase [Micromonospora sp. NBC_01655]MCX4471918.1 class I SAM-dependent methyltransferase [Micromonospora sp. NBC_01655]